MKAIRHRAFVDVVFLGPLRAGYITGQWINIAYGRPIIIIQDTIFIREDKLNEWSEVSV